MVENGGLPQAAPPPPHRRRFKLDSPASDVAWPRTAALTAAGMVLALMLAVTVPGTRLSGVVGTAAKHLTTTSLSYLTGAIPIQLGLAANGSSGEDGGSDSSEMVDISENSSSDDSGGSSAEPGSEGSSGVAEPESEGSSGDAEPEGEESSGGGEPKGREAAAARDTTVAQRQKASKTAALMLAPVTLRQKMAAAMKRQMAAAATAGRLSPTCPAGRAATAAWASCRHMWARLTAQRASRRR